MAPYSRATCTDITAAHQLWCGRETHMDFGRKGVVDSFGRVRPSELFANSLQFLPTFRGSLGTGQLKPRECVQNNLGDDQPCIFLVVGRDDVPRRVDGARRFQAGLVGCMYSFQYFRS